MKFKKNRASVINIIIPFILLLGFIYIYIGNIGRVNILIEQAESTNTVGNLVVGNEVGQTFYSESNNISGFSFKIGTYMRINSDDLVIGIREYGKNTDIYSFNINSAALIDNEYYNLRFPPIKFSKNKLYYIYIKSLNGAPNNSITIYYNEQEKYNNGDFCLNQKEQKGDLVFRVYYNQTMLN